MDHVGVGELDAGGGGAVGGSGGLLLPADGGGSCAVCIGDAVCAGAGVVAEGKALLPVTGGAPVVVPGRFGIALLYAATPAAAWPGLLAASKNEAAPGGLSCTVGGAVGGRYETICGPLEPAAC